MRDYDFYIVPPKLKGIKYKIVLHVALLYFWFSPIAGALFGWFWFYDIFISFFICLVMHFLNQIVVSKLRNAIIPQKQKELNYSLKVILSWWIALHVEQIEQDGD